MRPTNLGFRSPKERTAEFSFPSVTHDGLSLPYLQQSSNQSTSLSKSKRFAQYDQAARRTASQVGPGSYSTRNDLRSDWSISGTPVIRPLCGVKDPNSNAYYFIGNQMVFDSSFIKKSHKSSLNPSNFPVYQPVRLSTSSTPQRQNSAKPGLNAFKSPYIPHK